MEGNDNQDIISQLPDSILHYILSFLPTKEVVRSSLVSKRWRGLWASVQSLDFNCLSSHSIEHFIHFVNRVLILRDPIGVHTFRLSWHHRYCHRNVDLWVSYAIMHNVRVLDLCTAEVDANLPCCISTCQSLVTLRVAIAPIPHSWYTGFRNIKNLVFHKVQIRRNGLQQIISGSSMIEDLSLENIFFEKGAPSLHISSRTLRILRIVATDSTFQICAPSLTYLHYEHSNMLRVSLKDTPSLICAFISVDNPLKASARRFMKDISMTKNLKLFGPWIELVSMKEVLEFQTFKNLETITLTTGMGGDNFQPLAISYFLRESPNLKHVTLKDPIRQQSCQCDPRIHRREDQSGECPRLVKIEIVCFKFYDKVRQIVETFILSHNAFKGITLMP